MFFDFWRLSELEVSGMRSQSYMEVWVGPEDGFLDIFWAFLFGVFIGVFVQTRFHCHNLNQGILGGDRVGAAAHTVFTAAFWKTRGVRG